MKPKELLDAVAFVFTIFMVLYGLVKGFDALELVTNILYFSVLILSQVENLKEIFVRGD